MAEKLLIRRKTLSNQSINQSIDRSMNHVLESLGHSKPPNAIYIV